MEDLTERLTRAFEDVFASKVYWFGSGGPGYFGVRVENVAPDGAELDLVVTFRAGVRYCCFESACQFAYYDKRGWALVRKCLDRHGLSDFPSPVIRKFRGIVERGAIATPSGDTPYYIMEGSEYETGPFQPITGEEPASDSR